MFFKKFFVLEKKLLTILFLCLLALQINPIRSDADDSCLYSALLGRLGSNSGLTVKFQEKVTNSTGRGELITWLNSHGVTAAEGVYVAIDTDSGKALSVHKAGVLLQSKPPSYLLGSKLSESFEKLRAHRVGILIVDELPFGVGAMLSSASDFSPHASGFLQIPRSLLGKGTLFVNHELQHAMDYIVDTQSFLSRIPPLPKRIGEQIKKILTKKQLSKKEQKMIKNLEKYVSHIGEARASEKSIRQIFSKRGLKEILLPKNLGMDLLSTIVELGNSSFRNFQVLVDRIWIDPLRMSNIYVLVKAVGYGYFAIKIPMWATQGFLEAIFFTSNAIFGR